MSDQRIETLIKQLNNLDPMTPDRQFEAAIALSEATDESTKDQVVDALIGGLSARQALVRAHSAESLGMLGKQTAVPDLINILKDSYQLVRSYAARALGKLEHPDAIVSLLEVLGHDPFFGARAEAAEAIRKLCPDDSTDPCKEAREGLKKYREMELQRNEERSRRVLAEMDISLKEIESIFCEILELINRRKAEEAGQLAEDGIRKLHKVQDGRDRMGGLLLTRDRYSSY